jgi:hypothetical protein
MVLQPEGLTPDTATDRGFSQHSTDSMTNPSGAPETRFGTAICAG